MQSQLYASFKNNARCENNTISNKLETMSVHTIFYRKVTTKTLFISVKKQVNTIRILFCQKTVFILAQRHNGTLTGIIKLGLIKLRIKDCWTLTHAKKNKFKVNTKKKFNRWDEIFCCADAKTGIFFLVWWYLWIISKLFYKMQIEKCSIYYNDDEEFLWRKVNITPSALKVRKNFVAIAWYDFFSENLTAMMIKIDSQVGMKKSESLFHDLCQCICIDKGKFIVKELRK